MKYNKEQLKKAEKMIEAFNEFDLKNGFATPEELDVKYLIEVAIDAIQAGLSDHAIIYLQKALKK